MHNLALVPTDPIIRKQLVDVLALMAKNYLQHRAIISKSDSATESSNVMSSIVDEHISPIALSDDSDELGEYAG